MLKLALFLLITGVAYADDDCTEPCRSELVRIQVAPGVLNDRTVGRLAHSLENPTVLEGLEAAIKTTYEFPPFPFPHDVERCEREKALQPGNPLLQSLDCQQPGICGRTDLGRETLQLFCLALPCGMFEGSQQVGACNGVMDLQPDSLSFTQPITVHDIDLSPPQIEVVGNRMSACFVINRLELGVGVGLGLNTTGTQLADRQIQVNNIRAATDGPRTVCARAQLDFNRPDPVQSFEVDLVDPVFVSDNMIREAAAGIEISGLSGYSPDEIAAAKTEIGATIFRSIRPKLESSVQDVLGRGIRDQVNQLVSNNNGQAIRIPTERIFDEVGLGANEMRDQINRLECAYIRGAGELIPEGHPCLSLTYSPLRHPITRDVSPDDFEVNFELFDVKRLAEAHRITSPAVQERLRSLQQYLPRQQVPASDLAVRTPEEQERFRRNWPQDVQRSYQNWVGEAINIIDQNRAVSSLPDHLHLITTLGNGGGPRASLSVPGICDPREASPHAGRSIPNCPVQVYADLNEFNKVLRNLWENGSICNSGQREECRFSMAGVACNLGAPPEIRYDTRTRKYKTSLDLNRCYRGRDWSTLASLVVDTSIGGDFNIDVAFTAETCEGGDFCVSNAEVDWAVVPGTERGALTGLFAGMARDKIDEAITGAVANRIRLPLSNSVSSMLPGVTVRARGRVDAGPGYFGACLSVDSSGRAGSQ